MAWVLRDFDPRVTALARTRNNCTVNYRHVLSSDRELQNNKPATVCKKFQGERKNWSLVPDGFPAPRQTGRLTVGRKLTSTSTSVVQLLRLALSKGSNKVCLPQPTWRWKHIQFPKSRLFYFLHYQKMKEVQKTSDSLYVLTFSDKVLYWVKAEMNTHSSPFHGSLEKIHSTLASHQISLSLNTL
jgi:hypothetical protein